MDATCGGELTLRHEREFVGSVGSSGADLVVGRYRHDHRAGVAGRDHPIDGQRIIDNGVERGDRDLSAP